MPKQRERTWSDEQLREAVASSTTYLEVCNKLGLSPRGHNHITVRERILALTLDTSHFAQQRPFTDAALRESVPSCTSYGMVATRLGLEPVELNVAQVRRRITALGIDTAHFQRRSVRSRVRTRWSDDDLRAAVSASLTIASTIRALGLIPAGGNYDHVQRRIADLALDTSHFRGQGWNKGQKFKPRVAAPLEEVLVAGRWTTSNDLRAARPSGVEEGSVRAVWMGGAASLRRRGAHRARSHQRRQER